MNILLRRQGSLVDVGMADGTPLPQALQQYLEPELCYLHKQFCFGAEAYDRVTGERQPVQFENRRLYAIEQGRVVTGYGFAPRLLRLLQRAGHDVRFIDLSPPRVRLQGYDADWEALSRQIQFRPGQQALVEAVANAPGGIVNAVTGMGKSYLFHALAVLYPHAKMAIVAQGLDVGERIVRHLARFHPNVGWVCGKSKTYGRLTVYSADSLAHADGDVDFLLADEVHRLVAPSYGEALAENFRQSRNFGFSASPYARMDGAHARLEMLFGPEIFRLTYPEAVRLGLVVPMHVRWVPVILASNPAEGRSGVPRQRWGVWRNTARNRCLAEDVRDRWGPETQVLIAVATIEHAVYLWEFLPEFTLCYSALEEQKLRTYQKQLRLPQNFQAMTPARRNQLREAFETGELKRVIATDVWSTGVDFAALQVLYRADARQSEILDAQWPGRATRVSAGKECGWIVDFLDCFDKHLRAKSYQRKKHYGQQEWQQEWPRNCRAW